MKIPSLKATDTEAINNEAEYNVRKIDSVDSLMYYNTDFMDDDKERVKFIKDIEKIVRTSNEYRNYVRFLKAELDITSCSFLPQININDIKVSLEFHHYPFTLFDLTNIVLQDHILRAQHFISPFEIAEDVMKLHYEGLVGLVPVSKTVHELAHSGEIFINLNQVFGNVKEFVTTYKHAIPVDNRDTLRKIIYRSEKNESYTAEALSKKITLLDIESFGSLKAIKPKEENKLA